MEVEMKHARVFKRNGVWCVEYQSLRGPAGTWRHPSFPAALASALRWVMLG